MVTMKSGLSEAAVSRICVQEKTVKISSSKYHNRSGLLSEAYNRTRQHPLKQAKKMIQQPKPDDLKGNETKG